MCSYVQSGAYLHLQTKLNYSPVGMAANDLESIARLVIGANSKGHKGGAVHGVKILAPRHDLIGEGLALGQSCKARRLQTTNHILHGMVRIGTVGEEGACLLGEGDVLRVVGHLSKPTARYTARMKNEHMTSAGCC